MLDPFIGSVLFFAFDWAPDGFLKCDGKLISIRGNESLFGLIKTTYGGDGQNNFALPNLIGRHVAGISDAIVLGAPTGNSQVTLMTANLPAHSHSLSMNVPAASSTGDVDNPASTVYASVNNNENNYAAEVNKELKGMLTKAVDGGNTSSMVPVNIMAPYLTLNPCIACTGLFPSRG